MQLQINKSQKRKEQQEKDIEGEDSDFS